MFGLLNEVSSSSLMLTTTKAAANAATPHYIAIYQVGTPGPVHVNYTFHKQWIIGTDAFIAGDLLEFVFGFWDMRFVIVINTEPSCSHIILKFITKKKVFKNHKQLFCACQ